MTEVFCVDESCKYNKRHKCRKDKINLSYRGRRTISGFEEFRACNDYEENQLTKTFRKMLKQKEGEQNGKHEQEDRQERPENE